MALVDVIGRATKVKRDIDKYFARNGSCMFHATRYARHRLIDAIKNRHRAGESVARLADDYELPRNAIRAALASMPDDNRMTPKGNPRERGRTEGGFLARGIG